MSERIMSGLGYLGLLVLYLILTMMTGVFIAGMIDALIK